MIENEKRIKNSVPVIQKSAMESERKSKIISTTIIVSLALLLGLLLAYRKCRRTKLDELRDLDNKYRHVMESLAKAEEDMPNESDWQRLMETTEKTIPLFHTFILNSKLSRQEIRVCLLTRLNFSNKEMMVLLNTTKQSISNSKSKANIKLFDDRNAETLLFNLRNIQ